MGISLFLGGFFIGVVALIVAARVADWVEDKKRQSAKKIDDLHYRIGTVHDRINRSNDRITTLERDSVILNKRADCALAYVDGSMAAHEQAFHAPKSTQGDKKGGKK